MSAARPSGRRGLFLGGAVIGALALVCFGTLPLTADAMRRQELPSAGQPPSLAHPLGTDLLGRDVLARTLYGGALSLGLGLTAAIVAVALGTLYGAAAALVGGRTDALMMRAVDVLYALPSLLLVMLLTAAVGDRLAGVPLGTTADGQVRVLGGEWARLVVLALAIGGVTWLTVARVVRGQVLTLRSRPYVEAARAMGVPTWRILVRHLLPNLLGPITAFGALAVPGAILQESFLSFLGVGVQPPQATWGSLAAEGVRLLNPVSFAWWLVVFPCAALCVTLLSMNALADGLRDRWGRR